MGVGGFGSGNYRLKKDFLEIIIEAPISTSTRHFPWV